MPDFQVLLDQIFREHFVYGHLPYLLLVASVLMRDMRWLRVIAIAAGLLRIYIRAEILYDPVTVMWESVLIIVNLVQLAVMWWDGRHARMDEDQKLFVRLVMPEESRSTALAVLGIAEYLQVEAGARLTLEGEKVPRLIFITEGVARIEKGGQIVAVCGRGDFLGEMSFISGGVASASAVAERSMRIISFDNVRLSALMARNVQLRRAMEASFNRNLIDKLAKSTGNAATATANAA